MEKYTQVGYISDVESLVEGIWLSGYCGNFGVRYDDTGWTDSNWVEGAEQTKNEYRSVTSLAVYLERFLLNGATVIDGPEIIWSECFRETEQTTSDDGYTTRNWDIFEQFDKVTSDFFRQVVNGTIRIPTREEVIKRTKVMIVNDVRPATTTPSTRLLSISPRVFTEWTATAVSRTTTQSTRRRADIPLSP